MKEIIELLKQLLSLLEKQAQDGGPGSGQKGHKTNLVQPGSEQESRLKMHKYLTDGGQKNNKTPSHKSKGEAGSEHAASLRLHNYLNDK